MRNVQHLQIFVLLFLFSCTNDEGLKPDLVDIQSHLNDFIKNAKINSDGKKLTPLL
jgi:hypothetical protein